RVIDLVERAYALRATEVFPVGGQERYPYGLEAVRRALDPNENFRPALALAGILLVAYAIAVGPIAFLRASKRKRPLEPLKWVPALSLVTFGLIVLTGMAGRGWRGRARHLALVESASGSELGTVRRFRGFFASRSEALAVTPLE